MTTMSSNRALIPSKVTARDPKGIKLTDVFAAALNKAGLDEDEAQRVIENPEFPVEAQAMLRKFATRNEFANEEVPSKYGYLSGYTKPRPITEQLEILRQYFPEIGDADESIANQPVPEGAEGYFAIPRWQLIGQGYGEALEKVVEALKKQRKGKVVNYREGNLGPNHLRLLGKTARLLEHLGQQQSGYNVLVVAAQFGIRHAGRSGRRAVAVMGDGAEFALGPFEGGCMLLTHPNRLQHYDDLWIDNPGVEYAPDAGGRFDSLLCWSFDDGQLRLDYRWVGHAYDGYGSASGFSPQ